MTKFTILSLSCFLCLCFSFRIRIRIRFRLRRRGRLQQGWTWPKMGSVLLAAVFIALHFATGGLANPDAKRLYDDLLSNYNRLIRPVGNNSDRLTVKMGLRLSQLIDVVSNPLPPTNTYTNAIYHICQY